MKVYDILSTVSIEESTGSLTRTAVFVAGASSNVKRYIAHHLLHEYKLETIDSNDIFETSSLLTNKLLTEQAGIMINNTNMNVASVKNEINALVEIGYDTTIVFVNTDADKRKGKQNLTNFQEAFGYTNVQVIDSNSKKVDNLLRDFIVNQYNNHSTAL